MVQCKVSVGRISENMAIYDVMTFAVINLGGNNDISPQFCHGKSCSPCSDHGGIPPCSDTQIIPYYMLNPRALFPSDRVGPARPSVKVRSPGNEDEPINEEDYILGQNMRRFSKIS